MYCNAILKQINLEIKNWYMLRHSLHNSSSRITHPIFNFQCLFFHYRYLYIPMFILLLYIRLLLHRCFSIKDNFRPLSLLSRGYFDVTFSFHSIARKNSKDTQVTPIFRKTPYAQFSRPQLNAKLRVQIPPVSKAFSVENFSGLVWTEGLTGEIKHRFQISATWCR